MALDTAIQVLEYFKKEGHIMKGAPVLSALLLLLGWFAASYMGSERLSHRDSQIDSLREQVRLYEIKLEVTSPDQAIEKMKTLHDNLDMANHKIKEFGQDASLLKPICFSKDDKLTRGTMEQILINNEVANELTNGSFDDYCTSRLPKPPASLMIPPQPKSYTEEMDDVLSR